MARWSVTLLALLAVLGGLSHERAGAHSGLRRSDPPAGATLGDTPTLVRLSFSEKPEPTLSIIRVLDTHGAAYQSGRPELVAGDPLSLAIHVRPLPRGVYTVSWRIVSAVDGHATDGSYVFGVLVAPESTAPREAMTGATRSPREMFARWVLIVGLVALLGAGSASVAGFGGARDARLGAGGWLLAVVGLGLLAVAQTRSAGVPLADFLDTFVGRSVIWRAAALGVAGGALALTRWRPRSRLAGMSLVALAALAAMAIHVAAGHAAAAEGRQRAVAIAGQWAHFAAVGVWIGGLAALLFGVRGAPSADKAARVRRFSSLAAIGLLVVALTGALRTIGEISSWSELISTGYGRAVLVKLVLLAVIAVLGAANRWRSVPAAAAHLGPLRWIGTSELTVAVGALAAAAVLGTLPTPASGRIAPLGLETSGADFGTTVRVHLTTASDQPGPNRFVVQVQDYDSRSAVRARRVSLRFTPLDDPGVTPTSLALAPGPEDSHVGTGANMAFDGRWRVTVQIEHDGDSVEVPLELETRSSPPFVSILRVPGKPPEYTVQVTGIGHVRFSPNPERTGRSEIAVTCFNGIFEAWPAEQIVVTLAAEDAPARKLPVRRLDRNRFVADGDLRPGRNRIAAVAHASDGSRVRATLDIDVPGAPRSFRFW